MIQIFIGYDKRERTATSLLIDSLNKYSSSPLSITLIKREQLQGILTRPRGSLDSTDFSTSRFLTPYISEYAGWSIFMDCDMLLQDDITKLWNLQDDQHWDDFKYATKNYSNFLTL